MPCSEVPLHLCCYQPAPQVFGPQPGLEPESLWFPTYRPCSHKWFCNLVWQNNRKNHQDERGRSHFYLCRWSCLPPQLLLWCFVCDEGSRARAGSQTSTSWRGRRLLPPHLGQWAPPAEGQTHEVTWHLPEREGVIWVFLTVMMSVLQPLNPRKWLANSTQWEWLKLLLFAARGQCCVCLEPSRTWTQRLTLGWTHLL